MPEEDGLHQRLIKLPKSIWAELDDDAEACKRSSLKQLEAVLTVYYKLGDVDLRDLSKVRDVVSPGIAARPEARPFAFKRKVKNLTGEESRKPRKR